MKLDSYTALEEKKASLERKKKATVPAEMERNRLRAEANELRTRQANLGIFAGKEKRRLQEEIDDYEHRAWEAQRLIEGQQKKQNEEIAPQIQEVVKQLESRNIEPVKKRIEEITSRLKNPRT